MVFSQRILFPSERKFFRRRSRGETLSLARHHVHETFRDEASLGMAIAPVGAHRRGVGVNAVGVYVAVLNRIGTHTVVSRHRDDVGGGISVSTV